MQYLGPLLGLLLGISLGAVGGGGSILAVPIFVYVYGQPVKASIAMALSVVGATSLVGGVSHARSGRVDARAILFFAPGAMLATFIGSRLAQLLDDRQQLTLFGIVLLTASALMFRDSISPLKEGPSAGRHPIAMTIIGAGVGLLTGLIGVGGGFLIVPALVLLGEVPMRDAVGTSLFIIALNSAVGFAGYIGRVSIHWQGTAVFLGCAVAGVLLGSRMSARMPPHRLKRISSAFLLLVAAYILLR